MVPFFIEWNNELLMLINRTFNFIVNIIVSIILWLIFFKTITVFPYSFSL